MIKAIQPTLQGMVRLFIANADASIITLYKEVSIPIQPNAPSVPVPTPQYIMYEMKLSGDLKLNSGFSVLATTQLAQSFNIVVEGLDWVYPETLPDVCCNFEQDKANTGIGIVSAANPNLDGTGTIVTILQAGGSANGTLVKNVTIKALQSTHEGAVRIFVSPDGTTWTLLQEIYVPQTIQSAFDPSFKQTIDVNFNLESGYYIGASTQIAESFAVTIEAEDWSYPIS